MVLQAIMRFVRHQFSLWALSPQRAELMRRLEAAKQFAVEYDWFSAIQNANLILGQSAPRSGLKRWIWNRRIRPIQREVHQHFEYWETKADAAYDKSLTQSRWLAGTGKFADAIAILEPIHQQFFRLEGKQHLEALAQVLEDRQSLHLALLAERDGRWETAIDLYDRLLTVMPEIVTEIRFRRAMISIKTEQWDDASQRLTAITKADSNSLRATSLLDYVASRRLADQRQSTPIPLAKKSTIGTTQLEAVWLREGGYSALHRWSIAAYTAALEQPDRHGLETCLISRNMALANLAEYSPESPAAQQELVIRLKQQMLDLIQAVEDSQLAQYLTNCNTIDELAICALKTASCPALRWKSLVVTPRIHRRYPAIAKVLPQLPESYLGALYTSWAEAILLWQQGNGVAARRRYPLKPNSSPADRYAKRYVAYYEGCDYLTVQPGGYPRWREAKPHLLLAQPEIRATHNWQNQLNQLFETYYAILWEPADRREFTQFWVDLLNTATAHSYFQQAHDN
jgi:hypothetical protein